MTFVLAGINKAGRITDIAAEICKRFSVEGQRRRHFDREATGALTISARHSGEVRLLCMPVGCRCTATLSETLWQRERQLLLIHQVHQTSTPQQKLCDNHQPPAKSLGSNKNPTQNFLLSLHKNTPNLARLPFGPLQQLCFNNLASLAFQYGSYCPTFSII